MPRLSNEKQELYCRHRARGMIPSKAALAAGYAAGSSTTHLENDPEVIARIAELMEEVAAQREAQRAAAIEAAKVVGQLTGVTRSWVIQQLAEVAGLAKNDQAYKEAVQALELIGKDFGMFRGGSEDDSDRDLPQTFDMDKLDAVLDQASPALPTPNHDERFPEDIALQLIEGQVKKTRVPEAERRLSTGSETDAALMEEFFVPDEDLDPEPSRNPNAEGEPAPASPEAIEDFFDADDHAPIEGDED